MIPAIIEVAINGLTSKARNPNVPISPEEIASESIGLLDAGAAVIHNHIEDIRMLGAAAAARYAAGWAPVLTRHPDAILCPTTVYASNVADKVAHLEPCFREGARMAALDPGSINLANTAADGSPGAIRLCYMNSFEEIGASVDEMARVGLAPSIAIYEPSFLRATLAYHRAGKLPYGTMVKFYFAGDRDFLGDGESAGTAPVIGFGLPPTARALDVYLDMLDGSGLTWSVAMLGGDLVGTGMARMALERGGHVRVGLEDYAGDDSPTNRALLDGLLAECAAVGRPVATMTQAADMMGLSPAKASAALQSA